MVKDLPTVRNCPYFDPRKRVKKDLFDHVFLFF